jgi:hypothetical protein
MKIKADSCLLKLKELHRTVQLYIYHMTLKNVLLTNFRHNITILHTALEITSFLWRVVQ